MPLLALLDLADGLLHGAGEGAAFMAEQLAFQQVLRNRAAIDGDERLLGARTEFVQRLRQGLLAGAAFAQQQHRDVGGGKPFDVAADLQHGLVAGHDAVDRRAGGPCGEAAVLRLEPVQVQPAFDDRAQHLDFHRLLAEIVGAGGNRLEGVLALAVAGDDDHLGFGRDVLHFLQAWRSPR